VASGGRQSERERLFAAVRTGGVAAFAAGESIPADLIRRLILGLPAEMENEPAVTPAGIRLRGPVAIERRLNLDDAMTPDGGPIPALTFDGCIFEGGFSGAHGRFSRLSFDNCTFRDEQPEEEAELPVGPRAGAAAVTPPQPKPSLDLSGARVESDLHAEGAAPDREGVDHLWIRAPGLHVGGSLFLNRAKLRAPPEPGGTRSSDPHVEALTLALAEIDGDIWFVRGESLGRINGRGLRVGGDVWMSGAQLSSLGHGDVTLFLQSAHIGGVLMLHGHAEKAEDGSRSEQLFTSHGELKFLALHVGVSLILEDVDLYPGLESATQGPTCLNLSGATVGNSVQIGSAAFKDTQGSRLRGQLLFMRMTVRNQLVVKDAGLGGEAADAAKRDTIEASPMTARHLVFRNVRPLAIDENRPALETRLRRLSVNIEEAELDHLEFAGSHLSGDLLASSLTCAGNVILDVRIGGRVEFDGMHVGGSLDLSELRVDGLEGLLSLKDGKIERALRLARTLCPDQNRRPRLDKVRRGRLRCLPGTSLIETLWAYDVEGAERMRQVAFLERKGLIRLLDRHAETLSSFVRTYGHGVRDRLTAAEYFRLLCAYGPSHRDFRWVAAGPDKRRVREAWRFEPLTEPESAPHAAAAAGPPPAGSGPLPFDALDDDWFVMKGADGQLTRQGRHYTIRGPLLLDDRLVFATFDIIAGDRLVWHDNYRDVVIGPRLGRVPWSDSQFVHHPHDQPGRSDWVTPDFLPGMEEISEDRAREELEKKLRPNLRSGFSLRGTADLRGLSCDSLEDEGGRLWGRDVCIPMNHFVYRQATWEPEGREGRKSTVRRVQDWLRRQLVECAWPRSLGANWKWAESLGWFEFARRLRDRTDYWETWQDRRNWLYQQFRWSAVLPCRSRHSVDEFDYTPQTFEQAVRVARAEGREDVAAEFEMLKRRVEWRLFNRRSRWPLAILAIVSACGWLVYKDGSELLTALALLATLALMISASWIYELTGKLVSWRPARWLLTSIVYFLPAVVLFFADKWKDTPFDFLIAFLIYMTLRSVSLLSHAVMRLGFGYLRRPVRAIGTLMLAFVIGWLGVHHANVRNMVVIDAEAVADLAGPDEHAEFPQDHSVARGDSPDTRRVPILMGSGQVQKGGGFVRDISCAPMLSEPLYALDILIPLVDLREESRCEIRRVPDHEAEPSAAHPSPAGDPKTPETAAKARKAPKAEQIPPSDMGWGDLLDAFPEIALDDHRFWWWMKALYAIAGWFLVSLALLTFTQVNRMHAEPPTEHR
jgi:hypothetical protein